MNELILDRSTKKNKYRALFVSVSVLALTSALGCGIAAAGEDDSRPTVRLELGARLERVDGGEERFAPPFVSLLDTNTFSSPLSVEQPPRYAFGGEGQISFSPNDSNWTFAAAISYGRSNKSRALHEQTRPASPVGFVRWLDEVPTTYAPVANRFLTVVSKFRESHTLLDFQVGRDMGIGLFGRGSSSNISTGLRIAQFQARSANEIGADPDFSVSYWYQTNHFLSPPKYIKRPFQHCHVYQADETAERSFHGMGPSISWHASIPLVGSTDTAEVALDWGANAALLFGRQRVSYHHETSGSYQYHTGRANPEIAKPPLYQHPYGDTRSRSVTVPNVGGFAGLSLKFPNAKLNLGYRGDFFFGAMDGGIDTRKIYDRNFHCPFATISIGSGG